MKPRTNRLAVASILPVAALCMFLQASAATARVLYMVGEISGTVNGTAVDFDLHIALDLATGEETATVSDMDPEMGAILRQVTAMVTVGGPTGGATPQGGDNLFALSGGNFVNSATMYWPRTKDTLELVHTVSYTGGDTMRVVASINGTVPVISAGAAVKFADFTEIMYWREGATSAGTAQVVTTGVGFEGSFSKAKFRRYTVEEEGGGEEEEGGKGSTTTYTGNRPSGPVLRTAKDISTTYDPETRTMSVHLYNILTPVEAATAR